MFCINLDFQGPDYREKKFRKNKFLSKSLSPGNTIRDLEEVKCAKIVNELA